MRSKMSPIQLTILTSLTMLGTGFVMFPTKLAYVGGISFYSWIISAIGATAMAYVFAKCGFYSKAKGGLGGFSEYAFGRAGSFITNYTYGISLTIANVAIAIATTVYFLAILDIQEGLALNMTITIAMLVLSVVLCFFGPRFVGILSVILAMCILIPTFVLITAGWFWFDPDLFRLNWNPHDFSFWDGIASSISLTLWSFFGLESACANSEAVENPEKNVPRAVLASTFIVGTLYLVSMNLIAGIVPYQSLAGAPAPIAIIFTRLFGHTASMTTSVLLALSCFGALISWQFTMGMVFKSSADIGYLPRFLAKTTASNAPVVCLLTLLVVQLFIYLGTIYLKPFNQFDLLVDYSVFTNLVPYILCIAALPKILQAVGELYKEKWAIFACVIALIYTFFIFLCLNNFTVKVGAVITFLAWPLWGFISLKEEKFRF